MTLKNFTNYGKKRNRTIIAWNRKLLTFWYWNYQWFFPDSGMVPAEIDRLNSLVREGEILGTVHFNILADNPYIRTTGFCSVKGCQKVIHLRF